MDVDRRMSNGQNQNERVRSRPAIAFELSTRLKTHSIFNRKFMHRRRMNATVTSTTASVESGRVYRLVMTLIHCYFRLFTRTRIKRWQSKLKMPLAIVGNLLCDEALERICVRFDFHWVQTRNDFGKGRSFELMWSPVSKCNFNDFLHNKWQCFVYFLHMKRSEKLQLFSEIFRFDLLLLKLLLFCITKTIVSRPVVFRQHFFSWQNHKYLLFASAYVFGARTKTQIAVWDAQMSHSQRNASRFTTISKNEIFKKWKTCAIWSCNRFASVRYIVVFFARSFLVEMWHDVIGGECVSECGCVWRMTRRVNCVHCSSNTRTYCRFTQPKCNKQAIKDYFTIFARDKRTFVSSRLSPVHWIRLHHGDHRQICNRINSILIFAIRSLKNEFSNCRACMRVREHPFKSMTAAIFRCTRRH